MVEQGPQEQVPPTVKKFLKDAEFKFIPAPSSSRVKLTQLDQVCIVVKDVDKAVEFYSQALGWGPWWVCDGPTRHSSLRGKPIQYRMRLAFTMLGPLEIELIEIAEGAHLHTEFLEKNGEGLHHLRFDVDNIDAILPELAKEGVEAIWRNPIAAYLNTEDLTGGAMIELIQDN